MAADSVKVGILILSHNAPYYVRKTLKTLRLTQDVRFETIVLDNASRFRTRFLLQRCLKRKWIDKLCMLNYNSLFSRGNNIASRLIEPDVTHILLLNSDVEIRDPLWLRKLLDRHMTGITAYGVVKSAPITRVDGWCFLIDRHLYTSRYLDESFQWHWAITKMQAHTLTAGLSVQGIAQHEELIHHFGRKSGKAWRGAAGMKTDPAEVVSWFQGKSIDIVG